MYVCTYKHIYLGPTTSKISSAPEFNTSLLALFEISFEEFPFQLLAYLMATPQFLNFSFSSRDVVYIYALFVIPFIFIPPLAALNNVFVAATLT